jgi:hypothetical protein
LRLFSVDDLGFESLECELLAATLDSDAVGDPEYERDSEQRKQEEHSNVLSVGGLIIPPVFFAKEKVLVGTLSFELYSGSMAFMISAASCSAVIPS